MLARIVTWLSAEVLWLFCCTVFLLYFYVSKNAYVDASSFVTLFIQHKKCGIVVLLTVVPVMRMWYQAHDVRCRTVKVKIFLAISRFLNCLYYAGTCDLATIVSEFLCLWLFFHYCKNCNKHKVLKWVLVCVCACVCAHAHACVCMKPFQIQNIQLHKKHWMTVFFKVICCTESIYSVYKNKSQNCSCNQFE
jgi:hypothetical protein